MRNEFTHLRYSIESDLKVNKRELEKIKNDIEKTDKELQELKATWEWVREVSNSIVSNISSKVEDITSSAVQIAEPNLELKVNFVNRRNNVECDLLLHDKSYDFYVHPIEDVGGGIADITSFALRLVFKKISNDTRNILFVDEPFKFVSLGIPYIDLLQMLKEKMKIQLIVLTHREDLKKDTNVDRIIHTSKDEYGVSSVDY